MKLRNGFVSNSSSSSFIIGIAKLLDEDQLNKEFPSDFDVITVKELKEKKSCWGIYLSDGKFAEIDSFTYSSVSLNIEDMKDEDKIVYFHYHYGDDSDFWNEDGGYYEYDVDVEDITADEIWNVFQDGDILDGTSLTSGAGRDG